MAVNVLRALSLFVAFVSMFVMWRVNDIYEKFVIPRMFIESELLIIQGNKKVQVGFISVRR